ncbi:copper amine oxidase [Xylariaceae sp. FL1019]|nr:copper amine oxidase [Xylariaceae sp. FL1019]
MTKTVQMRFTKARATNFKPIAVTSRRYHDGHLLADLSAAEIEQSRQLVQSLHPNTLLSFKAITLEEPDKDVMKQYLQAEHSETSPSASPTRQFALRLAWTDLTQNAIARRDTMGASYHGNVDFAEVVEVGKLVLEDDTVKAKIAKLQLSDHLEAIPEPWGSDQMEWTMLGKGKPDYNHYVHPLCFSPVFDPVLSKFIRIERISTGAGHVIKDPTPSKILKSNEYVPDENELRHSLRELHVVQRNGPSFTVSTDRTLRWQKWQMHVTFNYREGVVLRDVRYGGNLLLYCVSPATDDNVDTRTPYHRNMAFDLGDVGAGTVVNNLRHGCECLGAIAYLDGLVCDRDGKAVMKENVLCIHEPDAGIGWKHSNYRTEHSYGAVVTRKQHGYILAFVFNQAAEFEYESRATGVLSTSPIDEGVAVDHGTAVHPGALTVPPLGTVIYQSRNLFRSLADYVSKRKQVGRSGFRTRTFAILLAGCQQASRSRYHTKRAECGDHTLYYTNQSRDSEGIKTWNPALGAPPSRQATNQSVLVTQHAQATRDRCCKAHLYSILEKET